MARLLIIDPNQELGALIASAAQSRGHSARFVRTGSQALAALSADRYDVALVDLVLPDMGGTEVLAQLRAWGTAAIALSAQYKGPRYAREATEVYGARFFFEKPFQMGALLAAVDRATRPPPTEAPELPLPMPADEPIVQGVAAEPLPAGDEPDVLTVDPDLLDGPAMQILDAEVVTDSGSGPALPREEMTVPISLDSGEHELVHEALIEDHEAQLEELSPLEEEFLHALDEQPDAGLGPATELSEEDIDSSEPSHPREPQEPQEPETTEPGREELGGSGGDEPSGPDRAVPFAERGRVWTNDVTVSGNSASGARAPVTVQSSGNLRQNPVPRLLTSLYESRHTGELRLLQGEVLKAINLEEGRPVYAASNLVHERFGRFCARKNVVPENELGAVQQLAQEANLRTGEAMVRLGLISPEQRESLLAEQIREIIWSTFLWDRGEYTVSDKRLTRSDVVRLSVFSGDLIMNGVLRTETLVSLRRKVSGSRRFFPTPEPPYGLHELHLSDAQAQLIAHADGTKTVEDLLSLTDLSERETLATLLGLEWTGQLHERRVEKASRRISFGL